MLDKLNLKLRTRLILSFGVVFVFIIGALLYGLYGFGISSENMNDSISISEQAAIASDIEKNLLTGLLEFKDYLSSNDEKLLKSFNEAKENIEADIYQLKTKSKDDQRDQYINNIQVEFDEFSNNFDEVMKLKTEAITYYDSIAATGYAMLDNLDIIKQAVINNEDSSLFEDLSSATEQLLYARLNATKYFDFHYSSYYHNYKYDYSKYMVIINRIDTSDLSDEHITIFETIKIDMSTYFAGMDKLYTSVTATDELVDLMDLSGPKILVNSESIIQSVAQEQSKSQGDTRVYNDQLIFVMGLLAFIGTIVSVLVIAHLLKLILTPINALHSTFLRLAEDEADTSFRFEIDRDDEIGQMSKAFNSFMVQLGEFVDEVNYQNREKTAQNDMANLVRDEQDMKYFAERLLTYLCSHTEGMIGSFYIKGDDEYTCNATYGYSIGEEIITFSDEDSYLGQVTYAKSVKVIESLESKDIDVSQLKVNTSIMSKTPMNLAIIPFKYEGKVNGVVEIGYFRDIDEEDHQLFNALSDSIGTLIHSAELRIRVKALLDKTMHQTEELQMQQEELKQSNEELEEQTRALKESESRLQAQQEELRVSNEELEERSKQLELQKIDLNIKNKEIMATQESILAKSQELEIVNRYKSEFLANMSHELRTPLNSILVLSQLLETRNNVNPLSSKEIEFATTINRSGNDLLKLINGVLDLSKVEAGRLELHFEKFPIKQVINDNRSLFEPLAEVKDIKFLVENYFEDDLMLYADSLRVNQITKNLISNAIKFTHEGHVKMLFRKPSQGEVNRLGCNMNSDIAIEVSDTGIGIAEDKIDMIFEAFKQSDGTTSRNYGGTGLGLTIALELSKLMGGHIILESEVGKGSKFIFILPIDSRGSKETSVHDILVENHREDDQSEDDGDTTDETKSLDVKAAISDMEDIYAKVHEDLDESASDFEDKNEDKNEDKIVDEVSQIIEAKRLDSNESLNEHRLLIIEDDVDFAKVLGELAKSKGYEVRIAHNGVDGINISNEWLPDGILLDMGLPDMEGIDLANKLEQNESTKNIPIHIISGAEQPLGDKKVPQSIIGFLKKPVDIKSIYETLAKIEEYSHEGLKRLLVVGTCGDESFESFANLGQIEVVKVLRGEEGLELINSEKFGCVVLDTVLDDMRGVDFLTKLNNKLKDKIPVVIYTEEIENNEYDSMKVFADSIIIKSSKSKDRLTDEVNLFLHDMKTSMNHYSAKTKISKQLVQANVKEKIVTEESLDGINVLIVDDDDRNVFALTHALEQYGMTVTIANNGSEAVEEYKNNKTIDIILMDIMMPVMNGYDATKNIRDLEKSGRIPIIALTAKAMKEDRNKCIEAGADDYMTKPINIEKLISLIKVWLA